MRLACFSYASVGILLQHVLRIQALALLGCGPHTMVEDPLPEVWGMSLCFEDLCPQLPLV